MRRRAAEPAPGGGHELVVAGRAGPVRRQVLAARLALDDRPRDRPRPARALHRDGGALRARRSACRACAGRRGGRRARPAAPRRARRAPAAARAWRWARPASIAAIAACRRRTASVRSWRWVSSFASRTVWSCGLVARVAHVVDHPRVAVLHPLEELEPVEQVGEAGRAQHDRDDVGPVRLVAQDELVGEQRAAVREPALQRQQPHPLAHELRRAWRRASTRRSSSSCWTSLSRPWTIATSRPSRASIRSSPATAPASDCSRPPASLIRLRSVDSSCERAGRGSSAQRPSRPRTTAGGTVQRRRGERPP